MAFTTIGIGGFSSNAGKTTLMCELLGALPGWEAVKITRGHYRSCGKSAHACCVSHLLSEEPLIRSGRAETYAAGKDTGRYWDAGASNVHWVVVTDKQVERGIRTALERVRSQEGVLIEGTSFVQFVDVDLMLMAARASGAEKIKPSARRALSKTSALYLFDEGEDARAARTRFDAWRALSPDADALRGVPVYTKEDLPRLVERVREVQRGVAA
jgi:molybdopterin-guanine dinucleotide biosynthesis protein